MNRLLRVFVVTLVCLFIYHVVVGWIWHVNGVLEWNWNHWRVFGWATFILRGIVLPRVVTTLVFRGLQPQEVDERWKRKAYWVCLLPLMISAVVDNVVWMVVSGYPPTQEMGGVTPTIFALFTWYIPVIACQWAITVSVYKVWFNGGDPDTEK